jgi:hypothetical protein
VVAISTAANSTTKFRFKAGADMRLPCIAIIAMALGLSGCAQSYGTAATGFLNPQVGEAYLPLETGNFLISHMGAAVVIAPGVAVTNAHNANLLDPSTVIGGPSDYDLLFFRTDKMATLRAEAPIEGEKVVAYGQGADSQLRSSQGRIKKFWPAAFGFVSDAGPGFSGGPVVDARSGALIGITYGYIDNADPDGRLMVAYNMAFVNAEFASVQARQTAPQIRNNR